MFVKDFLFSREFFLPFFQFCQALFRLFIGLSLRFKSQSLLLDSQPFVFTAQAFFIFFKLFQPTNMIFRLSLVFLLQFLFPLFKLLFQPELEGCLFGFQ